MKEPQNNKNLGFTEITGLLFRRLKRKSRKFYKKAKVKTQKAVKTIGPASYLYVGAGILVLVLIIGLLTWGLTRKNAYDIAVGENIVATIKINKNITEKGLTDTVDLKLFEKYGVKTKINETIKITERHAKKSEFIAESEIDSKVFASVTYQVEASVIYVEGSEITIVKNTEEVMQVKEKLCEPFTQNLDGELVSAEFEEDFIEEKRYVSFEDISTVESAVDKLSGVIETEVFHTVASGENMGTIAAKYNTTIKDVCELNGIREEDAHKLTVGQSLKLLQPKPFLNVITVSKKDYEEIVAPERKTQENPNMPASYTKVIQQGKSGKQIVTIHTTRVNGVKVSDETVNTEYSEVPQDEIIEVGTG